MTVCIVGHGPSLIGASLGSKIDSYPTIVRMKHCFKLLMNQRDFGKRTDYMCSSTEVMPNMLPVKAKEYWCYPKRGRWNKALELQMKHVPYIIPLELCEKWNVWFRNQKSERGDIPNYSTGMAAIIITMDRLRPKKIVLAGFDSLLNPEIPYTSTLSDRSYLNQIGHDWKIENRMLDLLSKEYNCEVQDIGGEKKQRNEREPVVREDAGENQGHETDRKTSEVRA